MATEPRDNSGSFNVNVRKSKDTHADFSGKIKVNGVMYWLDVYNKETDGREWWSVGVRPMETDQGNSQARPITQGTSSLSKKSAPVSNAELLEEDLPF